MPIYDLSTFLDNITYFVDNALNACPVEKHSRQLFGVVALLLTSCVWSNSSLNLS